MAEAVLSESEIKAIYEEVGKAFSIEQEEALTLDLQNFLVQIREILTQVQPLSYIIENNKGGYSTFYIYSPVMQQLLAKGYVLIFKFREFLTKEPINYRYYYNDSSGGTEVYSFTDNNILEMIQFGKEGLKISVGRTRAKAKPLPLVFQMIASEAYKNIISNENFKMVRGKGYSARICRSAIIDKYASLNGGLFQKDKGNTRQLFNRGHIYEALDKAITEIFMESINFTPQIGEINIAIENYVFGKFLARDNVKASKAADNRLTNTSIKSGEAGLYDYKTILQDLQMIEKILTGGFASREERINKILDLFLDKKSMSENEFQRTANTIIEELLKLEDSKYAIEIF